MIAFEGSAVPLLLDWRLRECDYGAWNGGAAQEVHGRRAQYLEAPYPGGESWQQAVDRVGGFLGDVTSRWDGTRVLVIGHVATRVAFEHFVRSARVVDLLEEEFVWREGWEYELDDVALRRLT
jgi:broad specificity phosphatase PhoE